MPYRSRLAELPSLDERLEQPIGTVVARDTIELMRYLRRPNESVDACLLRLILHYVFTTPEYKLDCMQLSERGRRLVFGSEPRFGDEYR